MLAIFAPSGYDLWYNTIGFLQAFERDESCRTKQMDIQPIDFPKELLEHNLSGQEQALIPADKLALAKDWNIIKRQNEWMMREMVLNRNLLAEHDKQLAFWGRVRWLVGGICIVSGTLVAILKQMGVFK